MDKFVDSTEVFSKYSVIDRKPYADYLTSFLSNNYENGFVLNLNAEWGAGKTTFLKCWYNELKQDHPVIYFDAWKSDFTQDAMTALIDCFHAQLANPIRENKELINELFSKGSHFVKKAIPSLVVGYLKHKTGTENDESLFKEATDTFGIVEKDAGDAVKSILIEVLEQRKKVDGIEEFKKALSEIAKEYVTVSANSESPKNFPVYVLIDELDRCRPTYAIEVIETVKHLFNIENFVFVIATDTRQLQHSIKSVYGSGFNANMYLSRFFDQSITLPLPELDVFLTLECGRAFPNTIINKNKAIIRRISGIFKYHNIYSLREVSKIIRSLTPILSIENVSFNIYSVITLAILRKHFENEYNNYIYSSKIPYTSPYGGGPTSNFPPERNSINVNLALISTGYAFEHFLNDCLTAISKPSQDYPENFGEANQENKEKYSKALICQHTFHDNGRSAKLKDYKDIIELSYLID
ncbi:KAP family P-loop NTPase fold protein [Photobacterium sanguinicancri]|uniref:KAP family P-loop NTPase fold protein n=1 Tax=Photobacterium sanguinicancri TaxID=875932 RepID=UPI00247FB7F4|nr:P-loop NTPase fold protein [Photobacterium sanguinicancri]